MYLRDAIFFVALVLGPMALGLVASVPLTGFRITSIGFLFLAALLSFLLGMSLSFFVSTLYMRSRIAFAGAVAVICGAFAAHGLFRLVPIETLLPGLAMHYALPPFAPPGGAALIAGLAGLGLIAACVAGALLLYSWLNSVDSMDYYATLPVGVPTVIRTKLLAFLVLTTGISTAFVVGVSALNGDVRLLWLALPVMFVTSVYMVVMTAYLTG